MRRAAAHRARRHALLLPARRSDGDDFLAGCQLPRLTAPERHGLHGRRGLRIDPQERHATLGVGADDTRRNLDGRGQLHFDRRGAADDAVAGRDQSVGADGETGSVGGRRPDRDDAVLPLGLQHRRFGLDRRPGRRRVAGFDLGVLGRQLECRLAAGDDVQRRDPGVELALEREGLIRFNRVISRPQADGGRAVERGHDAARRRAGRILADEQQIARHRRRLAVGVLHHDLDAEDARRLDGRCRGERRQERCQSQCAQHEVRARADRKTDRRPIVT